MSDPTGDWQVAYSVPQSIRDDWPDTGLSDIAYGDGKWVGIGWAFDSDYVYTRNLIVSSTGLDGSWTSSVVDMGDLNPSVIAYGDGYWVAIAWTGSDTTGINFGGYAYEDIDNFTVFTATDPHGTWTERASFSGPSFEDDPYFHAVGRVANYASLPGSPTLYDAYFVDSPGLWYLRWQYGALSSWKNLGGDLPSAGRPSRLIYADGAWAFISDGGCVWSTTDPTGSWTLRKRFAQVLGTNGSVIIAGMCDDATMVYGGEEWAVALSTSWLDDNGATLTGPMLFDAATISSSWTTHVATEQFSVFADSLTISYSPTQGYGLGAREHGAFSSDNFVELFTASTVSDLATTGDSAVFFVDETGDGYAVVGGSYGVIALAQDKQIVARSVSGAFAEVELEGTTNAYLDSGPAIYGNDEWAVIGTIIDLDTYFGQARIWAPGETAADGWGLVLS